MHDPIPRQLSAAVEKSLRQFPAVALLGPRQCGKTTLERIIVGQWTRQGRGALMLDLERPSDLAKLRDPEAFFRRHANELVCLDEVQRAPALFEVLRVLIDEGRRAGRFLLLGVPVPAEAIVGDPGWPPSALGADAIFLARGGVDPNGVARVIVASGRLSGQSVRKKRGNQRHHLDTLEQTFVLRTLPPVMANLGKRLVKTPKMYLRDSGLLHALLSLDSFDALAGHPVYGASWEGFVVEQIMASAPGWRASFYRTAKGDELDLVLEKRTRRVAVECKASSAPSVTPGFWRALEDLEITEAYMVAPIADSFPLGDGAEAVPLAGLLARLE